MRKASILMLGLCIILLSSVVSANLDTGVVGYWTFDNDDLSGTLHDDLSTSDNAAEARNGASNRTGYTGDALSLDNTNDWANATFASPSLTGSISIFCYAYHDTLSTGDGLVHKDNLYDDGSRDFWWVVDPAGGTNYRIYIWNTGGTLDDVIANTSINTAQWDYIGFTYNGSNGEMELFRNGVGIGRDIHSAGGDLRDTNPRVNFGRTQDDGDTSRYMDGALDECIIYNRALGNDEAAELYTAASNNEQYPFSGSVPGDTFSITAVNGYDSSSISSFNASVNGTIYGTTTGTINTSILSNTTSLFNVTVFKSGYHNASYFNYNVSLDLEASLYNVNTTLNISAFSNSENSSILNFTASIVGLTDGHNLTLNTTNGTIAFTVTNQTYNVSLTAEGYANNYGNSVFLGNWTSLVTNYQFNLYTENSFNITFQDESSLAVIDSVTINLDLISEVFSFNYSTSDGTLYIDLLTPAEYTFRYSGAGFQPRISSYGLTPDSYNEITLWLLPGGENVTIYVYDQSSDPVQGATIQIYRYSSQSNSYFLVNTIDTDFTGQAITNLELNSEFYKFFIYYGGQLKKQTAGAYVTGTELTFEINIEDPFSQTYYNLQDVDGYVTFNEDTLNFRFYFNDQGSSVSQGCLKIYTVAVAGESLYSSSCTAGSSALILGSAANVTGQRYVASGYVTIGGKDYLFDTASYTFQAGSNYGSFGVFLVIILTILAGTLMLWDISVSLLLLPLPTLIGSLPAFNWVNIPTEYAVGLEVMMVVLAFLMKKRPF